VHIFIDESGIFTTRPDGSSVGVVGALVVTEGQLHDLERRYVQLRPLLLKGSVEVKGRLLDESDVARVVNVARRAGLIFETTVIDFAPGDLPAIEKHRSGQCEALTRGLTERHHASVIAYANALSERLERMPLQLYAQSIATFDLLWRTLAHATGYYSQREPTSLAHFHWVIDAKAPDGVTDWEDWWLQAIRPFMQTRSLTEPFPMFEGGNYSHFIAKEMPIPEYLLQKVPEMKGESGLTLGTVFENIVFSAAALPGLELVDVLTNAVRRALSGRLGEKGWRSISGVMIHRSGQTYIEPMGFGGDGRIIPPATSTILRKLGRGGRSMLKD
jgi:hypothetical protein